MTRAKFKRLARSAAERIVRKVPGAKLRDFQDAVWVQLPRSYSLVEFGLRMDHQIARPCARFTSTSLPTELDAVKALAKALLVAVAEAERFNARFGSEDVEE